LGESKRSLVIDLFKVARKVFGVNEQREENSIRREILVVATMVPSAKGE
jgi:hypothetical protein